jgi:hypothetical protein
MEYLQPALSIHNLYRFDFCFPLATWLYPVPPLLIVQPKSISDLSRRRHSIPCKTFLDQAVLSSFLPHYYHRLNGIDAATRDELLRMFPFTTGI